MRPTLDCVNHPRRDGAQEPPSTTWDSEVLPIAWSDNDITLWPGESETLRATYRRAQLNGAEPVVSLSAGTCQRWTCPQHRNLAPMTGPPENIA